MLPNVMQILDPLPRPTHIRRLAHTLLHTRDRSRIHSTIRLIIPALLIQPSSSPRNELWCRKIRVTSKPGRTLKHNISTKLVNRLHKSAFSFTFAKLARVDLPEGIELLD
jgi:hypothetical protein